MPNITFSIPNDLYERMKQFPEIKWSTLYLQMIKRYLEKLETPYSVPISELKERIEELGISFDDITLDKAIELIRKIRELKGQRFYSKQID